MSGYYPMSIESNENFSKRIEKIKDIIRFFIDDKKGHGENIKDYEIVLITHYNIIQGIMDEKKHSDTSQIHSYKLDLF